MVSVKSDSSVQLKFWKILFKTSESKSSENLHTKIWDKVLPNPVLHASVFKKKILLNDKLGYVKRENINNW